MREELETMLKEAVVTYFKALSRNFRGEIDGRNLNPGPPKYKGVITTRPQSSWNADLVQNGITGGNVYDEVR